MSNSPSKATTSGGKSRAKTSVSVKSKSGLPSPSKSIQTRRGVSGASATPTPSIAHLIEQFGTEDRCHAYLEHLRWPHGLSCPRCQSDKISRIHKRRQFDCDSCRYQFSVRVGTVLQDSKLPLWKWFLATYLMVVSKKGISAVQLGKMTGVSYKTSWYLCHRIRSAMETVGKVGGVSGTVEVDETWVGGKVRGRGNGYIRNKTMVAGAVERGGEIRLRVVKSRDGKALGDFIEATISDDAGNIYTDEFSAYTTIRALRDEDTTHATVNHEAKEWVRGDVHTNSVEGVWSLLKRSIVGSYHQLSMKHLPAYLDEITFLFNGRNNPYLFRDTVLALIVANQLPYKDLIASH